VLCNSVGIYLFVSGVAILSCCVAVSFLQFCGKLCFSSLRLSSRDVQPHFFRPLTDKLAINVPLFLFSNNTETYKCDEAEPHNDGTMSEFCHCFWHYYETPMQCLCFDIFWRFIFLLMPGSVSLDWGQNELEPFIEVSRFNVKLFEFANNELHNKTKIWSLVMIYFTAPDGVGRVHTVLAFNECSESNINILKHSQAVNPVRGQLVVGHFVSIQS